jgi:DNA repair protein NreA
LKPWLEAYNGYVPLGVFNVRENIRNAMNQTPLEFEDMRTALSYISTNLKIPMEKFVMQSDLLKELLKSRQTTLDSFMRSNWN